MKFPEIRVVLLEGFLVVTLGIISWARLGWHATWPVPMASLSRNHLVTSGQNIEIGRGFAFLMCVFGVMHMATLRFGMAAIAITMSTLVRLRKFGFGKHNKIGWRLSTVAAAAIRTYLDASAHDTDGYLHIHASEQSSK